MTLNALAVWHTGMMHAFSVLCFVCGVTWLSPVQAREGKHEIDDRAVQLGQSHLELSVGDKVKINVFEKLGGHKDDTAKGADLIERIELSGEYAVQVDGQLYLPLLGSMSVHGKRVPETQNLIERAFQDAFGREARVTVSIRARSPIFVVGLVARPGTFEHTEGMTVLHALAQAGGLERSPQGEMYDTIREQKKVEEGLGKQQRIVARLETLLAERAGVPPSPSAKLIELAGEPQAISLIAEQQSMRALTGEARQIRLKGLDATIAAATRELGILKEKSKKMRDNSSAKEERVAVLENLATRGNGGSYQMLQAKSEYGDFQERLSEVEMVMSQVEERLTQAQTEKSRISTEAQLDLERDIAVVQEQAAEVAHQIATSSQLALMAKQASRDQAVTFDRVRYEIVRMTLEGPRQIEADETMPLMPGDLVKVQQPGQTANGAAFLSLPTN